MKRICISKDWNFVCPEQKEIKKVDIPHDYSICFPRNPNATGGASNGFYGGTSGEYTKYMQFDDSKHIILDIDGAYMCSRVFINENQVDFHPYGYTPILIDLTPKVRRNGTNKIVITTQNLQPSTRWYSGAGVYRDVFLWTGGGVRIEPRDIFVCTKEADAEKAVVSVLVDITADFDADIVLNIKVNSLDGKDICTVKKNLVVKKGRNTEEILLDVEEPSLWDVDNPYLYSLTANIMLGELVEDVTELKFGIRTISVDAEKGLLINGKSVKLKGGCIHHDHGGLGAISLPAAEYRKLSLLKQAGFNAVRIAHNPPSRALLEVCDEIGMFVMDEAFDMWNMQKRSFDYSLWFKYCWQDDIRDMVMRDRNHPCVISYSIGNEIPERSDVSDGAHWSRTLADEIRKYDGTRFVTSGVCDLWDGPDSNAPDDYNENYMKEVDLGWAKRTEKFMEPLDVVGYNYIFWRYEMDHEAYPKRVMWTSESKALKFYDGWSSVMRNSYVIGDFTWTAYDNIGEAGTGRALWERDGEIDGISLADYPWRTCYQGDFDLCGYRRPQSYFRESIWVEDCEPRIFTTHPKYNGQQYTGTGWHWYDVHETWTFEDTYIGSMVKTEVYSDADEIQFVLNGKLVGRAIPEKGIATLNIPYERGTLTAISYKNGKEIKQYSLNTVGNPSQIVISAEKVEFLADNRDLCYIDIMIADEMGQRVTEAECEISCKVDGGELMTVFSGNPANEDEYFTGKCHVFEGRAIAVIRSNVSGDIVFTVESKEIGPVNITVRAR